MWACCLLYTNALPALLATGLNPDVHSLKTTLVTERRSNNMEFTLSCNVLQYDKNIYANRIP